jgi:hypothetical protein
MITKLLKQHVALRYEIRKFHTFVVFKLYAHSSGCRNQHTSSHSNRKFPNVVISSSDRAREIYKACSSSSFYPEHFKYAGSAIYSTYKGGHSRTLLTDGTSWGTLHAFRNATIFLCSLIARNRMNLTEMDQPKASL